MSALWFRLRGGGPYVEQLLAWLIVLGVLNLVAQFIVELAS